MAVRKKPTLKKGDVVDVQKRRFIVSKDVEKRWLECNDS